MSLLQDVRFASRQLARRPGFAAAAILALGLGIGASTAVSDFLNLVLWRQLPAAHPDELVWAFSASPQGDLAGAYSATSYPDYADYRDSATSFTGLAAVDSWQPDVSLNTGERSLPVVSTGVSGNYFEVMGVDPIAGRAIVASDDVTGAEPVVVISQALRRRAFADEIEPIGRSVRLNGHVFTVVGVLAEGFSGTMAGVKVDLWYSLSIAREVVNPMPDWRQDRTRFSTYLLGRLRPGLTLAAAQAELDILAKRLDLDHPLTDDAKRRVTVTPGRLLHPYDQGNLRSTAALLVVAVALLLLLTSANVANLLLSRFVTRRREIVMRRALGAGSWRIARQMLTESVLLALAGGAVGLAVAVWARELLSYLVADYAILIDSMGFDYRVLGLALLICVATGLVFGAAPAIGAARLDLVSSIKAGDSTRGRFLSIGDIPAVMQIGLCTILVVGTVLLARSLWDFRQVDLGFEDENVLFTRLDLSMGGYSAEEGSVFFRRLEDRLSAIPGVQDVGFSAMMPPVPFEVTLHVTLPEAPEAEYASRFNFVDEGFFRVLGIPLLSGRHFDERDATAHGTAVINQALAEKLWPGEEAIGKSVIVDRVRRGEIGPEFEIVGVVASTSQHDLRGGMEPIFYFSTYQRYRANRSLLLSSEHDVESLLPLVRDELRHLDPDLSLNHTQTMAGYRWNALHEQRLQFLSLALCAVIGLLLAIVGVGSVMSFAVSRRRRELGIRLAIGAQGADIRRLVLSRAMMLALAGVSVGGVGALWAGPWLAGRLHGVSGVDPVTLIAVVTVLAFTAVAAAWLPARRASKVDPLSELRAE